ncbi:MAG TPA: right-handed parallel beta-helix repeat-containing protein, partial [Armatimonadota bacterium]|nr:right-handed parallel beta-helix repeat-containing protein [Armatimonadota bacterium]
AARPGEDAYVVFRLDVPGDMTRVTYGGRLYNRAPGSRIAFLHSFDGGATWSESYALTDTEQPWDVIHFVAAEAPVRVRSVRVKYLMQSPAAGKDACSLYSVRMEANYAPSDAGPTPLEVTFGWAERQTDYSLVERTHTQLVTQLPARYIVNVGGADHPIMRFLRVQPRGLEPAAYGYSDGIDAGGERHVPRWVTYGRNLAVGKPYTVSVPSNDDWGAGDPEGKRLTDGIVGPYYAGGVTPTYCLGWNDGQVVDITIDLGERQHCGGFRIHLGGGWPWWDALKGEVRDTVEVLTSTDGEQYISRGPFDLNPWRKDLPINLMLPDEETLGAYLYDLALPEPVDARFVRFRLTARRSVCVSEVQVLDEIRSEPFDLRIALPDERPPGSGEVPKVLTPTGRPIPAARAQANSAEPLGEPVLEPATLRSLGVHWIIAGDENENARVTLAYRRHGDHQWQEGLPLFRVERGAHRNEKGESSVEVSDDAWLFAGSALLLEPDTAYELRLRLTDPDGGGAERVLQARTITEPLAPNGMRTRYVTPGHGGGTGSQGDPFRGLAAAEAAAEPGDLFRVGAGRYEGTFEVGHSGEPGRPIIWRGEGEAVLDGQGQATERPGRAISASDVHDVWFEGLDVRNADYGIVAHRSARIVVRGCHISGVEYGLTCTNNDDGSVQGFFICDNTIEGPSVWPRSKGIEDARGIQVTGTGHVVCYNRITGFADAIDTFPSTRCSSIDLHNNDISVMTDDGIEMDYSERNTRCFENRLTNVFQGISFQPVLGGPVYAFRNALYNVAVEPFKLHNSPSGALMLHNTCVKCGMPLELWTNEPVRNCVSRNNLFIGTTAAYAYETTALMQGCDFDYDGFGGGPWERFLKWNDARFATLDDARRKAPVYTHAVLVDPATAFASGAQAPESADVRFDVPPDLRLAADSAAVDAGAPIGFCGLVSGVAPDLGAYELGEPLPHYGPR